MNIPLVRQGFLRPLTPLTYYVLVCLTTKELHAYLLTERVASRSGGAVCPSRGVMHNALKPLVDAGWIRGLPRRPGESSVKYNITPSGRQVLELELRRLRRDVTMGELAFAENRMV